MSNNMNANADYTTGAVKETTGNVVGSEQLQNKGRAQKEKGNMEYDTTNTTGGIGTTGGVGGFGTTNKDPSKTTGQFHATKGAVKEKLGSILNSESLQQTGTHERGLGNQEIEAAKTKNTVEGAKDQTKGTVKENVGHYMGNPQKEYEGKAERVQGKAKHDANV